MFQTFDQTDDPSAGAGRVAALRERMAASNLDWLIVPHADEFQSEYLPSSAERLAWLTGFTGSAGAAVIGRQRAVVFADGRYTLQVKTQTDPDTFDVASLVDEPLAKWLGGNISKGDIVGYDPWLHTRDSARALRDAVEAVGGTLRAVDANLVDAVWNARPSPPREEVVLHDESLAGRSAREKIADLRETLEGKGDAVVLTDPASVMWTFNIRGQDVVHTPLALARAIVTADGSDIFLDPGRMDADTRAALERLASIHEDDAFQDVLAQRASDARVMLDPAHAPERLRTVVEDAGGTVVDSPDPTRLPRARKNAAELEGARGAHKRDGVAMCRFLQWLDHQTPGTVDEITAARKLEDFRADGEPDHPLREISFDTISGSGPNGAIVHYRVSEATNRTLGDGELYLVDSGGQYDDGTTDITRTVAIGESGAEERRAFTLVLRGHIAIATARFPQGTRGQDLDPFARRPLWDHGLDFAHGTGHGVGSYLAVHEGPASISKRGSVPLEPGMILSNEPGFYREGHYGIRIENLIVVREPVEKQNAMLPAGEPMLSFETITVCPIDRRLIELDMLREDERRWVDEYHAFVRETLEPLVPREIADWLAKATAPL